MKHPLYLIEQGSKITRQGRRLLVTKQGERLDSVAILHISQVIVFGNIQITTPAIRLLLNEGVEVVHLSQRGRFYGRLVGAQSAHGAQRVAQVLASHDRQFALSTAQAIVQAKVHNMRVFLQRYAWRRSTHALHQAVEQIATMRDKIPSASTVSQLMGIEGKATAIYFSVWKRLLKAPWTFAKRVRRPPTDPANVLISFGYTLLGQYVMGAVLTAGLDPYVGFLHQLEYNRPSLVLDLLEEFRPLIADSVALRCLNNEILTPTHFVDGPPERPVILTEDGVRLFIREFETRLSKKFQHPRRNEQVDFRRVFLLQAYALAKTLPDRDRDAVYQPFLTR